MTGKREILRGGRGIVAAVLALLGAVPSRAVTDEEIFRDFRFNFINPGGRSLGMGGAFISIADDATAAQANPAGLTNLFEPQFFSELRYAAPDSVATQTGFRDPFLPEEGFDVAVRTTPSSELNPSFISYVHPVGQVVFGVSRQEVINTTNSTLNTYNFLLTDGSDSRTGEGEIELLLANFNFSLGWQVHDRLSVGASLSYGRLSVESRIVNTFTDPTGDVLGDPGLAGTPIEMYRTEADDDDTDVTFTAGLLWRIAASVRGGLVFRQGGDFAVDETLVAQPTDPALLPGQIAERVFFNESQTLLTAGENVFTFRNEFPIPDVWGLGLSGKPTENLTLSLDALRIEYSDLLEGFNSRLNVLTFGFQEESEAAFAVDDQTNLHFGAEYLFSGSRGVTWAARAGFHQDKDNRIRSDFAPGGFGLDSNGNFPGRDDEDHYSVGVGAVIKERFQLDVAGDFSGLGTEVVASVIYSF